jgi:nucleoside-diphosphate-sugar epimerase
VRILLIGGTGLISTAITRQLLEQGGHEVVHYNRGKRAAAPPAGVAQITGDRTDFPAFEKQMQDAGRFDCVMDMVGFQPDEADSVLRAFGGGRAGHYVFCSTVDVYDKPYHTLPVREDHPLKGTNDYGRKKAEMERRLFAAHEKGDLNVTTLRPGHTYDDNGALIHSFGWETQYLDRLKKGRPVIVHGDGSAIWTLAHAEDVGRAFVGAAGNPAAFGKAYNTAGDELLTWDMLYKTTARVMGWPEPTLVHIPTDLLAKAATKKTYSVADNFQFDNIMDNSRAREELGYRYTTRFEDAVRRIVPNLEAQNKIQDSGDPSLAWYDAILDAWARHGAAMAEELKSRFPDDL